MIWHLYATSLPFGRASNDGDRFFPGLCTVIFLLVVGLPATVVVIPLALVVDVGGGDNYISDASSCRGPEELRRSMETAKIWESGNWIVWIEVSFFTSSIS